MQKLRQFFSSSHAIPAQPDSPAPTPGLQHLIEIGEEVARGLNARPELDAFLNSVAQSIARRFPEIDHLLIFVLTPNQPKVTLRAAVGPVGPQLLAQEHELDVGGLSPVGRVTLSGHYLLIRDYGQEPNYRPHALLSQTRSELVIPLGVDETIIGALDVQSKRIDGFSDATISTLRALAHPIALAVDSLQVYATSQHSLRENQALYQQTQINLREIERLNYQLTGRAWSEYLRLHPQATAMTLEMDTGQVVHETEWTATLHQAATQRQTLVTARDEGQIVALPIMVRNEVIGAMEFELESGADMSPAALDLLAAVGQRLGMALDNRRLLDETQRSAQREAMINDIGADLQSASGVDAILQRAARHLQEALNAQEVAIRLGTVPTDPQPKPVEGETVS